MSRIEPRDVTCSVCGTAFPGWLVVPSRSRGPLTTDLRRYDEGEDPIGKQVCGCPGCGLTGEVADFEDMAPSPEHEVPAALAGARFDPEDATGCGEAGRGPGPSTLGEQLALHLAKRAPLAHADARLRYEHHAQVTRWLGRGPLREGDAWLRAAWLHSDRSGTSDALRCRRMALPCYLRGLEDPGLFRRREDRAVVAYLAGELWRRLGDRAQALRWYDQAIAWSSGLPALQDLVQLAERQSRDPRDLV